MVIRSKRVAYIAGEQNHCRNRCRKRDLNTEEPRQPKRRQRGKNPALNHSFKSHHCEVVAKYFDDGGDFQSMEGWYDQEKVSIWNPAVQDVFCDDQECSGDTCPQ